MTHGDAIVYRDGVEFFGNATRGLNFTRHHLAQVFQMHMAWYKLGKRVGNGDDGLAKVAILHACGTPQSTGTGHIATVGRGTGTVLRHGIAVLFDSLNVDCF